MMLFANFNKRKRPREFTFTPFYFQPPAQEEDKRLGSSRIKFKRIRHRQISSSKSIKIKLALVILLLIAIYYFRGLIFGDSGVRIEDIKIDAAPNIVQ